MKSLRQIANSFVEAMPMLLSVVGVLFFYLVVCAICGLSIFMEGIHRRYAQQGIFYTLPIHFGATFVSLGI